MDKYQFMVEVAKVYDERDHLREENDMLEKTLSELKRSCVGDEMTPTVAKVYDYGVKCLLDKCFNEDYYSIGVNEGEGGEFYPSRDLNEWIGDITRNRNVPDTFSLAEVMEICWLELSKMYDRKWESEVESYRKEHGKEGEVPF